MAAEQPLGTHGLAPTSLAAVRRGHCLTPHPPVQMFAGMLLFAAVVHFIPEPDLVDGDASVEGHDHSVLLGPTAYADDGAVSDVDSAAVSGENGDEGGDEDEDGERGPLPSADVEAMREELFAMRVPELREEAAKVGLRSSGACRAYAPSPGLSSAVWDECSCAASLPLAPTAKSVRLKADLVERLLTIRLNPEGVPSEWLRAAAKGPATPGVEGPASGLRRRTRSSRRSGVARTPAPEPKIPSTTTTAAATTGSGNQPGFSEEDTRRLMLTGIITAVGISLHNLPEGLVVYTATISGMCDPEEAAAMTTTEYVSKCFGRGLSVALAIALHNIPEGMAVAVPIMGSTGRCADAAPPSLALARAPLSHTSSTLLQQMAGPQVVPPLQPLRARRRDSLRLLLQRRPHPAAAGRHQRGRCGHHDHALPRGAPPRRAARPVAAGAPRGP